MAEYWLLSGITKQNKKDFAFMELMGVIYRGRMIWIKTS